jgi:hypothetical protein
MTTASFFGPINRQLNLSGRCRDYPPAAEDAVTGRILA